METMEKDNILVSQTALLNDWRGTLYPLVSKDWISNDLTNQAVSLKQSVELRNEIQYYLQKWDTKDPIGRYIQAHLQYLLAIESERTGDYEGAVSYYHEIWYQYPDTIWAFLAASRLQPIAESSK